MKEFIWFVIGFACASACFGLFRFASICISDKKESAEWHRRNQQEIERLQAKLK